MKRAILSMLLLATAMCASGAEPVGVKKERATRTVPPIAGKPPTPNPSPTPGMKSVSVSSSVFSSNAVTMLPAPGVLYPDLIPRGLMYAYSCDWNEAAGETCASACPPTYADLRFGARNVSNRALNGAGKVKVFLKATGALVREYSFNGLAPQSEVLPGKVRRRIEYCHTTTSVGTTPPATHELVVETAANEADKNNNKREFHIGPGDELLP